MPKLSIDFTSAQGGLTRPKAYLGAGLFLAGVVALAVVAWRNDELADANAALRAQRDRLAARMQRRQPVERLPAELSAEFEQAAAAHAQITTAWEDLFHALETSRSGDIALLTLSADSARKEFQLGGEAKDFPSLNLFSEALSANNRFRRVALSNHKLSEGTPPVVVRFELTVGWRQ